jgi:hypothetical protein
MSGPVAIPSYKELLWPTLQAVREIGDSGTIEEIVEKVIELEGWSYDSISGSADWRCRLAQRSVSGLGFSTQVCSTSVKRASARSAASAEYRTYSGLAEAGGPHSRHPPGHVSPAGRMTRNERQDLTKDITPGPPQAGRDCAPRLGCAGTAPFVSTRAVLQDGQTSSRAVSRSGIARQIQPSGASI